MRIGHGYDVHKFGEGTHIVLGGITIPYCQGLIAHSDGDVVLHALCDAILGALALGDIGHHFPDTDQKYRGADSKLLLSDVMKMAIEKAYCIGNVDITIAAQAPKIAPHIAEMRECIAHICTIKIDQVNVKATTTEELGFVGRKEGIAVDAVVLLNEV
jgi:2-C-methyl-D-erythritol 2,4-cyclodiphosphate synthase